MINENLSEIVKKKKKKNARGDLKNITLSNYLHWAFRYFSQN